MNLFIVFVQLIEIPANLLFLAFLLKTVLVIRAWDFTYVQVTQHETTRLRSSLRGSLEGFSFTVIEQATIRVQ